MKHYTYKERYEKVRSDVAKFMGEHHNKAFSVVSGGPKIEFRVSLSDRNGNKKILFDVIAHKQRVGWGLEKIANDFLFNDEYGRVIQHLEEDVINHVLFDPIVSIHNGYVRFRYVINPREEFIKC